MDNATLPAPVPRTEEPRRRTAENPSTLPYRRDIDGLRAVAVLAVVLFHLDGRWAPGGFVGVDIFFVISAFLITGSIAEQISAGRFSLLEFYRRRMRRILPALTGVVLGTLALGHWILLPSDLERLAQSAISAQLFAANIFFTFSLDTGYFADDASLEPLLHLWSLGVEEQFYFLWPLLLLAGLPRHRLSRLLTAFVVLMVASFVVGELLVISHPLFAYYMLPTRAGQLIAGALCYFAVRRFAGGVSSRTRGRLPGNSLARTGLELGAGLGVLLIAWSIAALDGNSGFPGFNAVPVTLGAALVIFAGSTPGGSGTESPTLVSRLLSRPTMVGIGRASYSIYLWHWPLLAFSKYAFGPLSPSLQAWNLLAITVLSYLSYRFIELPFRKDTAPFFSVARKYFLVPTAAILTIAGLLLATDGLGTYWNDERYRSELARASARQQIPAKADFVCQRWRVTDELSRTDRCIIGGNDEPRTLLWGDSNAAHYVGVLGEIAQELSFSFRNLAHSGCPPLLDRPERFVRTSRKVNCRRSMATARDVLPRFDRIIIAANWDSYLSRYPEEIEAELERTVRELQAEGKELYLLGRVPRISGIDLKCERKRAKLSFLDCRRRSAAPRSVTDNANTVIQAIARRNDIPYFDISDLLCNEEMCSGYFDNQLVYRDTGHLTMDGSILLGSVARQLPEAQQIFAPLAGPTSQSPPPPLPWTSPRSDAAASAVLGAVSEVGTSWCAEAFFENSNNSELFSTPACTTDVGVRSARSHC
ncbi:MAG: acyltransferase family protein [Acidobacteriota bacterium]|nr:acyltransferase family protein [Acidobacteriota bacterium]